MLNPINANWKALCQDVVGLTELIPQSHIFPLSGHLLAMCGKDMLDDLRNAHNCSLYVHIVSTGNFSGFLQRIRNQKFFTTACMI